MSKSTTPAARLPWEERWDEPSLDDLFKPLEKNDKRKFFDTLMERFAAFEGVEHQIMWHGTAWRWTVYYHLPDANTGQDEPMAYFVANPELPIVSIPLRTDTLEKIPIKRLNRYVREAIRSSKCSVDLHWMAWTPTASTEVDHLTDLFKRKHKILTAVEKDK